MERKAMYTIYCITARQPKVVTGPGRYATRSGEVVEVSYLGGYNNFEAFGVYDNGTAERWYVSGHVLPYSLSQNDIIQALP